MRWGRDNSCDIPPPVAQASSSSAAPTTALPFVNRNDDQCVWSCDACEIEFKNDEAFLNHLEDHVPCVARGCSFAADRDMAGRHYDFCHGKYAHLNVGNILASVVLPYGVSGVLGQTFEILMGSDPGRVGEWVKERKRRFPVTVRARAPAAAPAPTPAPTTRTSSVTSAINASSGKGTLDPLANPSVLAVAAALIPPLSLLSGSGVQETEKKAGDQVIDAQTGSAESAPGRGANLATREDENRGDSATLCPTTNSTSTSNPFWTLDHPERMRRFYALYQPSKITEVPLLWQKHQHNPATMWAALFNKYKVPQRHRAVFFVEQTAAPVAFLVPAIGREGGRCTAPRCTAWKKTQASAS